MTHQPKQSINTRVKDGVCEFGHFPRTVIQNSKFYQAKQLIHQNSHAVLAISSVTHETIKRALSATVHTTEETASRYPLPRITRLALSIPFSDETVTRIIVTAFTCVRIGFVIVLRSLIIIISRDDMLLSAVAFKIINQTPVMFQTIFVLQAVVRYRTRRRRVPQYLQPIFNRFCEDFLQYSALCLNYVMQLVLNATSITIPSTTKNMQAKVLLPYISKTRYNYQVGRNRSHLFCFHTAAQVPNLDQSRTRT